MWLWVLLGGLGLLGAVVFATWWSGRRNRRRALKQVWDTHHAWLEKDGKDAR